MILLKYLPFSLHWIVRYFIGNNIKTILDLGCGSGDFMKDISYKENWRIIGIELDPESIIKARNSGVYKKVIKADITNLPTSVTSQKYDAVVLIQVIEHLEKKIGKAALQKWEKLATKKIIIATPVGFIKYHRVEIKRSEKNRWQKHLSGWRIDEFTKRRYRVCGQGFKFIYGKEGLIERVDQLFWPVLILASYIFAPLVFLIPRLGAYMIAFKDLEVD